MGEVKKLPDQSVMLTLLKKHSENKDTIGSINGELGDRLKQQYESGGLTPFAWSLVSKVYHKGQTHELKAREMIDLGRWALDLAEELLDRDGHVGDIDKLARNAAPNGGMPLDQAQAVFAANAHKAPKPAEVDAKIEKRAAARKRKSSFVEEQAAETAKGDEHIKSAAKGSVRYPEKPDPSPPDKKTAPTSPKQAAADPGDISPSLDRRSKPLDDAEGQGSYTLQ